VPQLGIMSECECIGGNSNRASGSGTGHRLQSGPSSNHLGCDLMPKLIESMTMHAAFRWIQPQVRAQSRVRCLLGRFKFVCHELGRPPVRRCCVRGERRCLGGGDLVIW
jgi:hypothetical protein